MSDNMAATATAGAGGHFKVDTDAMQSAIKTWDQVIEELQSCVDSTNLSYGIGDPPAKDPASASVMHNTASSFSNYNKHAIELLNSAKSEQRKLQDALKAYQQNDSNAAHTAKHVQGHM